ncbi:MAG TPA: vWA domain-containing protein [Polyangiales bacterium]
MRVIRFCTGCGPGALGALLCLLGSVVSARAHGQNLIVDGTGTLGPATFQVDDTTPRRYDNVCVINGGVVTVAPYVKGANKQLFGNLELIAGSVLVDATSKIDVRGLGYRPDLCDHGEGATAVAGGRGGCSVMDSAGGGAHFGKGGRGTIDNPTQFPRDFEDDCMHSYVQATGACDSYAGCGNPGPSVAGVGFWHSIYEPEFGAAGGDKGCRDHDGTTVPIVGGAGGGRVVLVGLTERGTTPSPCGLAAGTVRIDGTIDAAGKRGCGVQNDSGGGGAGGTVLIVGEHVVIGATASLSAAGGLGGDTHAAAVGQPDYLDCVAGSQTNGLCDDCGGGGGGGVISLLSVKSDLDPNAHFDVSGALGGVCPVCQGEAGGGAGELQLDGAYVGELCDGYDNDFDGMIDEGFGTQACGLGSCLQNVQSCASGQPATCMPTVSVSDPTCSAPADGARPRVAVILDTSASMLLNLAGWPTFGDGSVEHPGLDTDADGVANDSRLFLAREALAQVMSAYPEIDFALARYHQDQGVNRSCQTAAWFECEGLVASYDNPTDNSGASACAVTCVANPPAGTPACTVGSSTGAGYSVAIRVDPNPSPNPSGRHEECINYAGSCGPPRRGADILSGFGTRVADMVRWLDGRETAFNASVTPGNVCAHASGGDCEVRGSGPTPLQGSLQAVEDYVSPIRATDSAAACRGYSVILVTDGAESCNGDPVAAARRLHDVLGLDVYVIAVSVLPTEQQSLNDIAMAGSGGTRTATFVTKAEELVPALTTIVAGSIRFESCNGIDDDCDGQIDEDFPGLGSACNDGKKGICRSDGLIACNASHDGTQCSVTSVGGSPGTEICNGIDDDCDGLVDEDLKCGTINCVPTGSEVCNGQDDDCDGLVDEGDPSLDTACGQSQGECSPGVTHCVSGMLRCIGGTLPTMELCNGKDDNCNGKIDDNAPCPQNNACILGACRRSCDPKAEFPCPVGMSCTPDPRYHGAFCLPSACSLCSPAERCVADKCVDPCAGVKCKSGETCSFGECKDCFAVGCAAGKVCYKGECKADPCAAVSCKAGQFCTNGACKTPCVDTACDPGQSCNAASVCAVDACIGLPCGDAAGEVCRGGKCVSDPCKSLTCMPGEVCVSKVGCVVDPCPVTRCPAGQLCNVGSFGESVCQAPMAFPTSSQATAKPKYLSAAGSGLSTCAVARPGAANGGNAMLLLGWLALVLLHRRRRQ